MKKNATLLLLLLFSMAGFSQVELDYSATPKMYVRIWEQTESIWV